MITYFSRLFSAIHRDCLGHVAVGLAAEFERNAKRGGHPNEKDDRGRPMAGHAVAGFGGSIPGTKSGNSQTSVVWRPPQPTANQPKCAGGLVIAVIEMVEQMLIEVINRPRRRVTGA